MDAVHITTKRAAISFHPTISRGKDEDGAFSLTALKVDEQMNIGSY